MCRNVHIVVGNKTAMPRNVHIGKGNITAMRRNVHIGKGNITAMCRNVHIAEGNITAMCRTVHILLTCFWAQGSTSLSESPEFYKSCDFLFFEFSVNIKKLSYCKCQYSKMVD